MENALFLDLTKQQQNDQRDDIVCDLFGKKTASIKSDIAALKPEQKIFLASKLQKHKEFYERIIAEPCEKPSFRVEIAKFRVNILYPMLLKLLAT